MRDSQYKSCAVQNQFTAYLIAAIRNYKRTYLRRISTAFRTELPEDTPRFLEAEDSHRYFVPLLSGLLS